jgi:hypothetical protein
MIQLGKKPNDLQLPKGYEFAKITLPSVVCWRTCAEFDGIPYKA